MFTALFAYLIYRQVSDKDLATRPDDSEQMLLLVLKGVWFAVTWPYHLIGLSRDLATPLQRTVWNTAFSALAVLTALTGIWNYLSLGILLALIKGVGFMFYAYRIHLRQQETQENSAE